MENIQLIVDKKNLNYQFTEEEAIKIAESFIWKQWSDKEVVDFQLFQDKLCMDFSRFHEAIEKVLERSVWTHEFANPESLRSEYKLKFQ
jgi:hypothetical protein